MKPKVVDLRSNASNIPAMLRMLADDIEAGREGPFRCIVAMAQPEDTRAAPEQYLWGASIPPTEQAGILMYGANQVLQVALVPK